MVISAGLGTYIHTRSHRRYFPVSDVDKYGKARMMKYDFGVTFCRKLENLLCDKIMAVDLT